MAVSPTKLSAGATGAGLVSAPPRDWEFLLTEANFYRSRDEITLVQRPEPWLPGMFVTSAGVEALVAADIDGIICAWNDTTAGPRMATVITRDAEVIDAYLQYGALVVKDVNTRLSSLAIITRQAVLPNVAGATFDPSVPGTKMSGISSSTPPVPPATLPYPQPASFFPSTLEAAEPDMPAAGSPQPAPPTVPVVLDPQRQGESDEDFRQRQEEHRRAQDERRQEEEQRRASQQGGAPPEAPRT